MTGLGSSRKQMQLWPKPDSQCTLTDFPLEIASAVGFMTAQGPTVCGGKDGGNKCFRYKEHQWMPWTNMGTARSYASALQINPNQTLIIGGYDENVNDLKTELISSSGSEEGTDFPVKISGHCSFNLNSTYGMVTGGLYDLHSYSSTATFFVDLTKGLSAIAKRISGPSINTARNDHGCSIFHHGGKSYGIVSGGWDGHNLLDSTEMIDLDDLDQRPNGGWYHLSWTEGMPDKSKIVYP